MGAILRTVIVGAIIFGALSTEAFAAANSKCKTVGGYPGCTKVPPKLQNMKNAKPLSKRESDRVTKPIAQ